MTLVVLFNCHHSGEEPNTAQQTRAAAAKADFLETLHSTSTSKSCNSTMQEVFGFPVESADKKSWITTKLSTYKEAVDCFSSTEVDSNSNEGHLTINTIMRILAKATYLEKLSNEMKKKFNSTAIFNYAPTGSK